MQEEEGRILKIISVCRETREDIPQQAHSENRKNLVEAKTLRADVKLDLAEEMEDQPEESSGKEKKKEDIPGTPTLDTREAETGVGEAQQVKVLKTKSDSLSSIPRQTDRHHGKTALTTLCWLSSDLHTCAI